MHSVVQISLFVIPVLVGLVLYWPALRLPLVYDTVLHTQFADDLNWITVWQPSERFGFYRPLVFAPMILIRQLFGGYPAVLLHTLNVGQHLLNVLLITALMWRLWRNYPLTLISGVLFASYPFTYQATIVYGNNAYLTATGLVLLGLYVYVGQGDEPTIGRTGWAVLLFILGVLVHETAILLVPLCLLLGLLTQSKIQNPKSPTPYLFTPSALILSLVASIYLTLYSLLPRGSGPLLDYGGNALWPKLLILMQSMVYPLVWFGRFLPDQLGVWLIVGAFVVLLAVSGWLAWARPLQRPLLIFGWAWWLGNVSLIGLTLPTYYIADGARLLYFGGVGVALVWGGLLGAPFSISKRQSHRIFYVMSTLVLAFVLLINGRFIRTILDHYMLASQPIERITAVMAAQSVPDRVAVVNFPQWVSPAQNTFLAGNEWSPVMGDHLFLAELFKANEGREFRFVSLTEPALLSNETTYNYGIIGARTVPAVPLQLESGRTHVFISRYSNTAIETDYTGQIVQDGVLATETPLATLGAYALIEATTEQCGRTINSSLTLTVAAPPSATSALFVQLLGADGRLLAQADGPPLGLAPERIETTAETILIDQRQLTAEAGEPAQLLVGLYDYASGERFPAVDEETQPLPDNALRLPLTPCSQ